MASKVAHKVILKLPVGGAGCASVVFRTEGINFFATIDCGAEIGPSKVGIVFERFTAFRFHGELHSTGYLPESGDCVCEILKSDWVAKLIKDRPKGLLYLDMRHFAVMLSDVGYLEVACEDFRTFAPTDDRGA